MLIGEGTEERQTDLMISTLGKNHQNILIKTLYESQFYIGVPRGVMFRALDWILKQPFSYYTYQAWKVKEPLRP